MTKVVARFDQPSAPAWAALEGALEAIRGRGGTVVTTNGCFDLLHPGHVSVLEGARAEGDLLVVGLNSDASVRALKGPSRPVLDQESRARMLLAMSCVDHVVIYDDLQPTRLLRHVRPDVHCKGGDYRLEDLPEVTVVAEFGGRVRLVPFVEGFSTTKLLRSRGTGEAEQPASDGLAGIRGLFRQAGALLDQAATTLAPTVGEVADTIAHSLCAGGTVLVCGNGGSATDAQHFASELVGRFRRERPAWSVVALTADSSVLTSIANDYGYEHVFSRQIEALGRPGDLLIAISTSGRSPNVLAAAEMANRRRMTTVALTGRDAPLADRCHRAIVAPSADVALIQQIHRAVLHALCEAVEFRMTSSAVATVKSTSFVGAGPPTLRGAS